MKFPIHLFARVLAFIDSLVEMDEPSGYTESAGRILYIERLDGEAFRFTVAPINSELGLQMRRNSNRETPNAEYIGGWDLGRQGGAHTVISLVQVIRHPVEKFAKPATHVPVTAGLRGARPLTKLLPFPDRKEESRSGDLSMDPVAQRCPDGALGIESQPETATAHSFQPSTEGSA